MNLSDLGTEHHFIVASGLATIHDIVVVRGVGVGTLAGILEELGACRRTCATAIHILAAVCWIATVIVGRAAYLI